MRVLKRTILSYSVTWMKTALLYVILAGFALVIPGLLIPFFSKIFVDQILLENNTNWLMPLLMGMGLTALVRGGLVWLQRYYLLRMETKIAVSKTSKFILHLLKLPVDFFSKRYKGDISARVEANDKISDFLTRELVHIILSVIMLIFYFVLMIQYDTQLAMIGIGAIIINLIMMKIVYRKRVEQHKQMLTDKGEHMGAIISGLKNIENIKATGSELEFFNFRGGFQAKVFKSEGDVIIGEQYLHIVPMFLAELANIAVLVLGCYKVMEGQMTIGVLVAFQSLMASFIAPVNSLVGMGSVLQEIEGEMHHVDDVMEYEVHKLSDESDTADIEDFSNDWQRAKLEGRIELNNITFGYHLTGEPLIKDLSISIEPGKCVALVGAPGSGKSAIAALISGLYEPWSGEVLLDGKPRKNYPESVITHSMMMINENICLFEGTIHENLSLWDKTTPESDIIRAAKDACIHEAISAREGGYAHKLSEGGRNFSGGERQRIEIARALASNPSILIMDEVMSMLDFELEREINQNIRKRTCTTIILTHRYRAIKDCDEIFVIEKGQIVQCGTHEELIKNTNSLYAELICKC